jgi:probable H4MPT-linked C1 transfer pathway protein
MRWLGLDIGGANLKAADGKGWAKGVAFPLWRAPEHLATALAELVEGAPACDQLAVTMTGELCDSFRTKAEGVRHILAATKEVAAGRPVRVYLVDGRFAWPEEAAAQPQLAAASNWHVLARFACRHAPQGCALLIDVGSTTTDIIPLVDGDVAARGKTDTERLCSGELVYSGVGRTPVCAVLHSIRWRGGQCAVAAELFATTADAYLVLGDIDADPAATWSADGRPLTKECARQRLARMVCADASELEQTEINHIAAEVKRVQIERLAAALESVVDVMVSSPTRCIVSGSGEFLARDVLKRFLPNITLVSLTEELGRDVSQCAPAHGLAVLAAEEQIASRG